jgi:hypothetical protein
VEVEINGAKVSYTVLRDYVRPEQWYYVPDQPRLFERQTANGSFEPEFALVRFQFRDPANREALLEGGILQFSAVINPPPQAIEQLRRAISQRRSFPAESLRLAALPIVDGEIILYSQQDGRFITSAPLGVGIAPTFATQKMAFQIPLSRIGSDLMQGLANGNGGIGVAIRTKYMGVTPPAGFRVTVDWDRTFEHYSRNDQFRARASYYGLFTASAAGDITRIREELVEAKAIEIDIVEGTNFTMADIDKYLQPLLTRINQEIVDRFAPPERIDPARAAAPSAGGVFGGAGYSVALKRVEQVRRGRETINFNHRRQVERNTVISGFIGIGAYPPEVRQRLVTTIEPGSWRSAFFMLPPSVDDGGKLGISQIDLEIRLRHQNDVIESQVVRWNPQDGWYRRRDEGRRDLISFPLAGLHARLGDQAFRELQFETVANITHRQDVIRIASQLSASSVNGDSPVAGFAPALESVTIDGSILTWRQLEPGSRLLRVEVEVLADGNRYTGYLQPRVVNGRRETPEPLSWMIRRTDMPVNANIFFRLQGGETIPWRHNGQDLRKASITRSLNILLEDEEIVRQ